MKVYVITVGNYSDYHICGVATDPESAENLRLLSSDSWCGEARIETFDTQEVPERPKTYFAILTSDEFGLTKCWERPMIDGEEYYINHVNGSSSGYAVNVIAEDKSHAVKIARDLIAQYKYERMVERGKQRK